MSKALTETQMFARRRDGCCPKCGQPITKASFVDLESRLNYRKTGMCQKCQDTEYTPPEDEYVEEVEEETEEPRTPTLNELLNDD